MGQLFRLGESGCPLRSGGTSLPKIQVGRIDLYCQSRQRSVASASLGPEKYGWKQPTERCMPGKDNVEEVSIADIKRPLQGTRSNDQEKVGALMDSIKDVGLLQPIDILLVEGKYYGFSGCHRYEACQKLGHEKILAKVRKANRQTLQMHFR